MKIPIQDIQSFDVIVIGGVPCDTCPALVDRFAIAADKLADATLKLSKLAAVGGKASANLKSVKLLRKE